MLFTQFLLKYMTSAFDLKDPYEWRSTFICMVPVSQLEVLYFHIWRNCARNKERGQVIHFLQLLTGKKQNSTDCICGSGRLGVQVPWIHCLSRPPQQSATDTIHITGWGTTAYNEESWPTLFLKKRCIFNFFTKKQIHRLQNKKLA